MNTREPVVGTIVLGALGLARPTAGARINRKLLFGDQQICALVRARLEKQSDDRCAYVVRSSTDPDAVRLRNRPPPPGAGVIYLVFWLTGVAGHERNYESLRDFPSVTLRDLLYDVDRLVLPVERAIDARCADAASGWAVKDRTRAAEHLQAAWRAVRICLRGGRAERDEPYFGDLGTYLEYLGEAHIPDDEWNVIGATERPAALVARWGAALPRLSMFRLPALGSVLGVQTSVATAIPSPSRSGEGRWSDVLDELLTQNKHRATDFAGLEEDLAGKQTLRERLDVLTAQVPLCEEISARGAARVALERFCQSGDQEAYRLVEWSFKRDRGDRSSPTQGLAGLLIARKVRAPRENPLDRLARETTELLERLAGGAATELGVVRQYVASVRGEASTPDRLAALAAADSLRSVAAGVVPPGSHDPGMTAVFLSVVASADHDPTEFDRLARAWEKYGRPDGDGPVQADSVLLGLVQLCLSRLREQPLDVENYRFAAAGESVGSLLLEVRADGQRPGLTIRADDWSTSTRDRIFTWLRDEVRPLYFDEDGDAERDLDERDAEDGQRVITIDVARVRGEQPTPFGAIEISLDTRAAELVRRRGPDSLSSYRIEGPVAGGRAHLELFRSEAAQKRAEDPRDDAVRSAWDSLDREVGWEPGCAELSFAAPVPEAGRQWVDAWATAVSAAGAADDAELVELERRRDEADYTDREELKAIVARIKELKTRSSSAGSYDVESVRSLLRLATGSVVHEGRFRALVLLPHHPLVLRLAIVADDVLAATLRQLWTTGWEKRALDDLEGALDEWGWPEPLHCYGFWDAEPLVFDAWLDGRFALFSPHGEGREVDATRLGAGQVAEELMRYRSLFPAAADRLRLRLVADREGTWAWRVLERCMADAPRPLNADVDLVTDLPPRQPTRIDQALLGDESKARWFEPTPEGALPALRVRRRDAGDAAKERVHIAAVVGELIDTFHSVITPMAPEGTETFGAYDPRLLFSEAVPALSDYSLLVGDQTDALSVAVGRLVAQAASHRGQVFRERYSFDRERNQHAIRTLQDGAHWLVLTSRQPLYRAVQQCDTATLLDFYSTVERGRPVHTCVALAAEHAERDIHRLSLALGALTRTAADTSTARRVLAAARKLAPGVAMQCIGATGGTTLSGLLGLVLSAEQSRSQDGLVLSLDQHRKLLRPSGQLSDLLNVRVTDGRLFLDVIEAKLSSGVVAPDDPRLAEAQHQVASTIKRLEPFTLAHPLVLQTRARLARAIIQRIHLGAPDPTQAARWRTLIDAARDPLIPVVIGAAPTGAVHAWSLGDGAADHEITTDDGLRLQVHGRDATLAAIARLGS